MSDNVKRLNKMLQDLYGVNPRGEPTFRIVWSDEQFENRRGTYSDFYGKLFIRQVVETRLVPKYPQIRHEWILEKWFPPEISANSELPDSVRGSYEPVQVFRHANGEAVPVTERIVKEIIWVLFHPQLPGDRASDLKANEQIEFDKEVEHNKGVLEDAGSALIKDSEAII
jgi:hypothetical protein